MSVLKEINILVKNAQHTPEQQDIISRNIKTHGVDDGMLIARKVLNSQKKARMSLNGSTDILKSVLRKFEPTAVSDLFVTSVNRRRSDDIYKKKIEDQRQKLLQQIAPEFGDYKKSKPAYVPMPAIDTSVPRRDIYSKWNIDATE